MNKIGFFGGCFNPPTNIHIEIANNLVKQGKLDKVVFVPVNDYYEKNDLISQQHRFNMLKLAIKNFKYFDIEDIELKQYKKFYAVDIFKILNEKYINSDIFMIMGSDNYNKMPGWKDYTKIKDLYKYIVIERNNNDISSTQIRQMIKDNNTNVEEYIPKDVYKYILENNLYKEVFNG